MPSSLFAGLSVLSFTSFVHIRCANTDLAFCIIAPPACRPRPAGRPPSGVPARPPADGELFLLSPQTSLCSPQCWMRRPLPHVLRIPFRGFELLRGGKTFGSARGLFHPLLLGSLKGPQRRLIRMVWGDVFEGMQICPPAPAPGCSPPRHTLTNRKAKLKQAIFIALSRLNMQPRPTKIGIGKKEKKKRKI